MIGDGLCKTIEGVESVGGIGGWHDPLVVRLVKVLVDGRQMQPAVNPVDAEVGKKNEERELGPVVPTAGSLLSGVVELAKAANLSEEGDGGAERHDGHGLVSLLHLKPHLVLEKLGVVEGLLVKDENVREGGEDEVVEQSEDPGNLVVSDRTRRVKRVVSTYQVTRKSEVNWRYMLSLGQALM